MLSDFPVIKEPGELDCLPTCVQAVLLYQFGEEASIEDARRLCDAEPAGGCVWSKSVRALRKSRYPASEAATGDETDEQALYLLYDLVETNDLAVIVRVPIYVSETEQSFSHALVVVGVADDGSAVTVMNPDPDKPNTLETWEGGAFFGTWQAADFDGLYFGDE